MKLAYFLLSFSILILSCRVPASAKKERLGQTKHAATITDQRDGIEYSVVEIGEHRWFAENLRFESPKSVCYKKKRQNCTKMGRLYPHDELEKLCPEGWRVPDLEDWRLLKAHFLSDSIYALLDTVGWEYADNHTNASAMSIRGVGYQMKKQEFFGQNRGTTLWLNKMNTYDEFYHVHLYGGKGILFEKSNFRTNEVLHAHPIQDVENRRFSVRCVCGK